jgi:hypothetical protein
MKQCLDCCLKRVLRAKQGDFDPMTLPTEMTHRDILRVKLAKVKQEHRDLDDAIHAIHDTVNPDILLLKRLKRQKLVLKDKIAKYQDELTPDIIA